MRKTGLLTFILALVMIGCQKKQAETTLKDELLSLLDTADGVFAVAFKDLSSGEEVLINEHDTFHAASTMKTPVMIEAFKQAAAGKLAMTDSIVVKNEFASIVDGSAYSLNAGQDSEKELYDVVGESKPLYDLVYDMIIRSSNLATNIVIDTLRAGNVTQTMRSLGANHIQVLRGVEDNKAYEKGLSNTTCAYDLMVIFEHIARGDVVSPTACDSMIEILMDQQFNDIIPAHLPSQVKVAHKTGFITGVHHDSGIVFLPDGRKYVLVLLSRELPDFESGTALLATISKKIYDHVTGETK